MRLGELIPIPKHFLSKSTVPAGRAARAELGTVGISFGIQQSTGDTSKPSSPMQNYKPVPGKKQGIA
jgi:hypothetical protein